MICEYCHQNTATHTDVDGYPVCDECLDFDFDTCCICGGRCHTDVTEETYEFELVCNQCAEGLWRCPLCKYLCDEEGLCPDCRDAEEENAFNASRGL